MSAAADRLRALQTKQKAALVRWERAVRELAAAVETLAHLEQKMDRFTLNVFREGGYPLTPRQRKAIEARPRLTVSATGAMDRGAWRRRIVYDSRIGEIRKLEARWQPRIDAARARVHAAKLERHEAAQQVLAVWSDPRPVTGHSRRSLCGL